MKELERQIILIEIIMKIFQLKVKESKEAYNFRKSDKFGSKICNFLEKTLLI